MPHHQQNHQERLHGLDHLRALAIILVFLFHYFILSGGQPAWLPDTAQFGWTGVDLFFVLSGFLISSQLFAQIKKGQPISFKDFLTRRFFRIMPAYPGNGSTLFLLSFFPGKRKPAAPMEIFNLYSKYRPELKKQRNFFTLLVALCRRTFLPVPSSYSYYPANL
ncbi:acyltransferase family protein [Niabella sp. 22666]|uniref:acyltransferase family protein n=1 Tax=Niabella sp. 22666 TaxID=3453954 RepID=UPI003F83A288